MLSSPSRCAAALLAVAVISAEATAQNAGQPLRYPPSVKSDQVDDYHGARVADPYRWLEDVDSPETARWVASQNEITFSYLAGIPERAAIKDRLTKLWDYPKYGVPFREGDRSFWFENSGLQNQAVLYVRDNRKANPRVLLDPNTLSSDGTVALAGLQVSDNGRLLAYAVSASGSDWQEFRVRDIETAQDLSDTLKWIKFSGMSWTKDNKGFFYSRYDEPKADSLTGVNKFQKLYYHRIGTPQSKDVLIYERPDEPDWGFDGQVTDDGQYLIISIWQGTERNNRVYFIDLARPKSPTINAPVVKLLDDFDAAYTFIDNRGSLFYFQTNKDAPRERVVAIDNHAPRRAEWRTIIPEASDALVSVDRIGDRFVASYLTDARSSIRIFGLTGQVLSEVALPGIGTVSGISGDRGDNDFHYAFTSYLYPTSVFRYELKNGRNTLWRAPELDFDVTKYETKQVFYTSKDGTRVPMFITHRKGMALDGTNPTMLYAYGGFNIPLTPAFAPANLVWLEMGGVYAVANLRGGGEYGTEWHEAGTKERKQNVFDDFIAAAEYLIQEKYTAPSKLAIRGGSNGGLLVGAVMTQRPELFGVALPAVGVMDMLRFHKFTIGWGWVSDYGSSDDPAAFKYLHAYSPLHNLKAGTSYPATLITTADHDDRVVPGHSFKFAAALQAAQGGPAPTLIRIDVKAGHGAGKPTAKQIEEWADLFAFTWKNLGMTTAATP